MIDGKKKFYAKTHQIVWGELSGGHVSRPFFLPRSAGGESPKCLFPTDKK